MSLEGLSIETRKPIAVGAPTQLDFLVKEGQIGADAVVRYVNPGHSIGLKFPSIFGRLIGRVEPFVLSLELRRGELALGHPITTGKERFCPTGEHCRIRAQ